MIKRLPIHRQTTDSTRVTRVGVTVALFAGVLTLTACSSGTEASPSSQSPTGSVASTPSGVSTTPTPSSPGVETITIAVTQANDNVSPAPSKQPVPLGSRVILTVTSDINDEVHVHGYELEKPVKAGGRVTFDFIADKAGVFEVETHTSEKLLLQLQVS